MKQMVPYLLWRKVLELLVGAVILGVIYEKFILIIHLIDEYTLINIMQF